MPIYCHILPNPSQSLANYWKNHAFQNQTEHVFQKIKSWPTFWAWCISPGLCHWCGLRSPPSWGRSRVLGRCPFWWMLRAGAGRAQQGAGIEDIEAGSWKNIKKKEGLKTYYERCPVFGASWVASAGSTWACFWPVLFGISLRCLEGRWLGCAWGPDRGRSNRCIYIQY